MLDSLREEIDKLDDEIIFLLDKRFEIVKKIKNLNLKKNIEDKKREEKILSKITSDFIKNIYKEIFKNSKNLQKDKI
jgi:shikimate dehydrogenase